jgi:hypothetical protein
LYISCTKINVIRIFLPAVLRSRRPVITRNGASGRTADHAVGVTAAMGGGRGSGENNKRWIAVAAYFQTRGPCSASNRVRSVLRFTSRGGDSNFFSNSGSKCTSQILVIFKSGASLIFVFFFFFFFNLMSDPLRSCFLTPVCVFKVTLVFYLIFHSMDPTKITIQYSQQRVIWSTLKKCIMCISHTRIIDCLNTYSGEVRSLPPHHLLNRPLNRIRSVYLVHAVSPVGTDRTNNGSRPRKCRVCAIAAVGTGMGQWQRCNDLLNLKPIYQRFKPRALS